MNLKENKFYSNVAHLAVLASLAISPIFDLLAGYPTFFVANRNSPLAIVGLSVFLGIGIPFVIALIGLLFFIINKKLGSIVHIILLAFLFILIFLPILKKTPITSTTVTIATSIAVSIVFVLLYVRLAFLKSLLTYSLPIILLFPAYFMFISPVSKIVLPQEHASNQANFLKSNIPIVMITFDEASTTHLMNEKRKINQLRFPNFAALASQSYWFRNCMTVADVTPNAIPAILTGRIPKPLDITTPPPTLSEYPYNIFTWLMRGYKLNVYETLTDMSPISSVKTGDAEANSKTKYTLYIDVLTIFLHIILPDNFTNYLPDISRTWGAFASEGDGSWNLLLNRAFSKRAELFRRFVHSIKNSDKPTFNFIDLTIPHPPFIFMPSGKIYKHQKLDGLKKSMWGTNEANVRLGYKKHLLQLQFADTLLGECLSHLRRIDIFDKALIIVTSDHGASYIPGNSRRYISLNTKPGPNIGSIIPVPLFIKLPSQKTPVVSDRNVSTIDILPTIADVLKSKIPWHVDGSSVFDTSKPEQTAIKFLAFPNSIHSFEANKIKKAMHAELRRMAALFGNEMVLMDKLLMAPPFKGLYGRDVHDFPIINSHKHLVEIKEAARYNYIDLKMHFLPSVVQGKIVSKCDFGSATDIVITINDKIAGSTQTSKNGEFNFLLPESVFRQGKNKVAILRPLFDAGKLKFIRYLARNRDYKLLTSTSPQTIQRSHDKKIFSISKKAAQGCLDVVRLNSPKRDMVLLWGWAFDSKEMRKWKEIVVFNNNIRVNSPATTVERKNLAQIFGEEASRAGFSTFIPASIAKKKGDIRIFCMYKNGVMRELIPNAKAAKKLLAIGLKYTSQE